MSKRLNVLQEQRADAITAMRTLADIEGRDLSDEESVQYAGLKDSVAAINGKIDEEKSLIELEKASAITNKEAVNTVTVSSSIDMRESDPKGGFDHIGEFAVAVYNAARPNGNVDNRLLIGAAPTSFGNESSGADGGFSVPADFKSEIKKHELAMDSFLPMTDNTNVSGNGMCFPADETTPWGSDGVRAYWESEASQATQTKPVLEERNLRLRKLFALVPVTNELLADSSAMASYLPSKAGESIRYKTNDAFVNGDGAGKPLGIANSAALVSVAKESGQTADTIVAANVAKMYARNPNAYRSTWVVNHDALPQLFTMTIGDQPIWTPPTSGFKEAPGGMLLGRPVVVSQTCQTVGDAGDIYFVDWMGYQTITKSGGIEASTSMHLWFDYDVMAFRSIFRVDGQPWLNSAITPANGSNSLSYYVNLAARA